MQKYDFDKLIDRRGSGSYKWDGDIDPDVIQMWVADMDFMTAPAIINALHRRVDHGIFGYVKVPDAYYQALSDWFAERHGWRIDRDSVIYTLGVVPAVSAIIKALTRPGDRVIVQTPAYNCFFSSVRNNGCELAENRLVEDGTRYNIDFDRLEELAADPAAKVMIICNPHNPVGRIWSDAELTKIAEICRRHNVVPVSDEIHCELTYGVDYTPFMPIAARVGVPSVACVSPSKAFNTAGLQIANIISPDPEIYALIDRAINDNEVCDVNPFGVVGLIAAYTEGRDWLDQLRTYLYDNYLAARKFLAETLPLYTVTDLEATYLMWVDIRPSGLDSDTVAAKLLAEGKVHVSPGSIYGDNNHIRLNIAMPHRRMLEGLGRIVGVLS